MAKGFCMSIAVLLLSACSFKPMSVNVQPVLLTSPMPSTATGQPVWLSVSDGRDSPELGSRSISGKTAAITAQNDLLKSLRQAFVKAYAAQGFSFVSEKVENVPELKLILLKTDYVSQSKALQGTVTQLNTELRLEARSATKRYEKNYRSSVENKSTFTPMQAAVEEMVNSALSDVLQRAVNDKTVQALLLTNE